MKLFVRLLILFVALVLIASTTQSNADEPSFPPEGCKRILFLGDSITYAGQYVAMIETQLLLEGSDLTVVNAGLPSETCTGLSEPDHPFPRPNIHERLERCFEKYKPDAIVACYGMNDGIYHPFSEQRFKKYQQGIDRLIEATKKHDVKLVLLTPPPFDPLPFRKSGKLVKKDAEKFAWFSIYENYDSEVMRKYADFVLSKSDEVHGVVDLREPIIGYLKKKRLDAPDFVMSNDGVHVNQAGHQLIATTVLKAWNYEPSFAGKKKLQQAVQKRMVLLRDAWLSHIGHKRPNVKAGLPLEQAKQNAPSNKMLLEN